MVVLLVMDCVVLIQVVVVGLGVVVRDAAPNWMVMLSCVVVVWVVSSIWMVMVALVTLMKVVSPA